MPSTTQQDRAVIFVHVPKAAGSTLRWIMDRQYTVQSVYRCDMHLYPSAFDEFRDMPEDERAKIRCLIGHLPYGVHEYLAVPASYVTVLRDPVDRFLSEYMYLRKKKWVAEQLDVDDREVESLEAYVDMQVRRNAMNFQTRQISGRVDFEHGSPPFDESLSEDALETAKENLEKEFTVVGLQERFDESLLLMKRAFGWGNVCYLKKNVTSRPVLRNDISSRARNLIERHNELDAQLVEFARKRFKEQVLEYGPGFERDLRDFEKKNGRYTRRKRMLGKAKHLALKTGRRVANKLHFR